MIIGHLPAGYLTAVGLSRFISGKALFFGVVIAAVLPDIDMVWFLLVDSSYHHHSLLPHRPIVWTAALLVGLATAKRFVTGLAAKQA